MHGEHGEVVQDAERLVGVMTRDKAAKVYDMGSRAPKYSIFDCIQGPHDQRFVKYKDISTVNAKFARQDKGIVNFGFGSGRDVEYNIFNPEPHEF